MHKGIISGANALSKFRETSLNVEDVREKNIRYQRSYRWRIYFATVGEAITLRASKVTLPLPFFETESWTKESTREYFPNVYDIGEISVDFREDEQGTIRNFIFDWMSQIRSFDGRYALPVDYKKRMKLHFLDVNGDVTTEYEAYGVFPKNPGNLEGDYATSGILIYTVAFSCDSMKIIVPKSSDGLGITVFGKRIGI